jgi:hypothetical protein
LPKAATEDPTAAMVPNLSEFDSILAEYGITQSDVYTPEAPTITKANFDELCIMHTELKDKNGDAIKNVIGHTGPLMFLENNGEKDGDKFTDSGYDGFYIFTLLSPAKGKVIITLGRPQGENTPPLVKFLDTLKKGALFQVASVKTSGGFHTFNPVPVQK